MVPRPDIVGVPAFATIDEIERVAGASGRSRLPVHAGDLDAIVGDLHVNDALTVDAADRDKVRAGALAEPSMLTPESRPVEDLMVEMRSRHQHMALVVDEFGSVSGLVTLEDLLEELIGDFEDETDRRRPLRELADGGLVVPGSLRPDELAAQADVSLANGDWETIAGYLIAELGRLPEVGDVVTSDECSLEVTLMARHRVLEITVRPASS